MKFKFLVFVNLFCILLSCKNEIEIISQTNENYYTSKEKKSINLNRHNLFEYLKNTSSIEQRSDYPEPFKQFNFDKVIAYEFNGKGMNSSCYNIENQRFSSTITNQKYLNNKEINDLIKLLTSNKTYGNNTAACFEPKLGVVFFKGINVEFVVDICLDCNFLKSTIEIPATNFKKRYFEHGSSYSLKGFSKKGMQGIIDFSKNIDFKYANFKPGIFHQD